MVYEICSLENPTVMQPSRRAPILTVSDDTYRCTDGGIQNGRFSPRFGDRKKEAGDSKNMGTPGTYRDASFLRSAHATASIAGRTGPLASSRLRRPL